MEREILNKEDFEPLIGTSFLVAVGEESVELRLEKITDQSRFAAVGPDGLPIGHPSPFALVFAGQKTHLLGQSLYTVSHPQLGELTLFIKPFHESPDGYYYETIFN